MLNLLLGILVTKNANIFIFIKILEKTTKKKGWPQMNYKLYRWHYENTNGLIFMIDGADEERFEEVKEELKKLSKEELLQNIPWLIFVNKLDLGHMSVPEI